VRLVLFLMLRVFLALSVAFLHNIFEQSRCIEFSSDISIHGVVVVVEGIDVFLGLFIDPEAARVYQYRPQQDHLVAVQL
jgi:hypothetical protein